MNPTFTRLARAAAGGIILAAILTSGPAASASVNNGTPVPPILEPPAGQTLDSEFHARGVQVYRCVSGAWVFLEPAANLAGENHQPSQLRLAIHFRGPSWESTDDGSLVEARAIASSPVAGSIPQLLLQATVNRGDGVFGRVSYIQRLRTTGGVAPTTTCADGQTSGVRYTALYRFFVPANT